MSDATSNGGLYRHYKGGLYQKLYEATDEATMTPVVVYRSDADGRIWVRPLASWNGSVHTELPGGKELRVPRFVPVEKLT